MNNFYNNFYKGVYRKTDGYIPLWPLMSRAELELGDLMLIQYGQMVKIGNIFDPFFGIYESIKATEGWLELFESWNIQSGVHQFFRSETGDIDKNNRDSELKLKFDSAGDYIFSASGIYQRSIENFHEINFKLLQELAAEKFSFTEVFVVTSIANAELMSLLVAAAADAQVIFSMEEKEQAHYSFIDIVNSELKPRVSQMESMASCYTKREGEQVFFKAQKLEISTQGKEIAKEYIQENLPESIRNNIKSILNFAVPQIFPSSNIFPSEVHKLFHFREMNLDDVSEFLGERRFK